MSHIISPQIGEFSVLLSVYHNTNPLYFHQALRSVWCLQTLRPSEVVLVQDGPVSKAVEREIEYWQDKIGSQFKLIQQPLNLGLASSLNEGLKHCSFDLIARMDDDDYSLPKRFELQVAFLMKHPEVSVLGTQIEERDNDLKKVISTRKVPLNHMQIIKFSKIRSPINHPSVMFRKSVISRYGGYPEIFPEDYALWGKLIINGVIFSNLPEKLLIMRTAEAVVSRRGFKFFCGECHVLIYLYKIGLLGGLDLFGQIIIRFFVRCSPRYIKKFLYKMIRH